MPTLRDLLRPQTEEELAELEELIARLQAGGEIEDDVSPWLGLLGGQGGQGGGLASLVGGGGLGAGGGAGLGGGSAWSSPGLAAGSGGSLGRGDVGLWGGQEVTGGTFPGQGPEYGGPIMRQRRTGGDNPFQVFPVPGGEFVSSFGAPRTGHLHQGVDIMAPEGTPNYAPYPGQVELIPNQGTAGHSAYVTNPRLGTSAYFHLSDFAPGLETGQRVDPGDLLGFVGATGNAAGGPPHTHFEYRPGGRYADAVDPYGELSAIAGLIDRLTEDYRPNQARYDPGLMRRLGFDEEPGLAEAISPSPRRRRRSTSTSKTFTSARERG